MFCVQGLLIDFWFLVSVTIIVEEDVLVVHVNRWLLLCYFGNPHG